MPVILLAEDVGAISLTLEDMLGDDGFTVIGPFGSCWTAFKWLSQNEAPAIAVLDLWLIDGSAVPLARELRARGVPVVFVSGAAQTQLPPDLADCPWIEKPTSYEALLCAVRRSLRHRRTVSNRVAPFLGENGTSR